MLDYYRPDNLNDGLVALREYPWTLLAGGTDFYPARVGKHLNEKVMDLTGIRELRSIRETGVEIHLGALTTWTDVVKAKLPRAFDGLKKAVKTIGGVQTQNAGTICGNICNASPAADSVPNLMALDAKVELMSVNETRTLPLKEFILGNRKTARKNDEFVTGILIPHPGKDAHGNFEKLGSRAFLVISIVMVGVVAELNEPGEIVKLNVAVGACSAVSQRLSLLEKEAQGQKLKDLEIKPAYLDTLEPIDDVRGSAAYRNAVIPELVLRAVKGVV
jgi:CO/xanthine dehydrogenase FAD-binding subunit